MSAHQSFRICYIGGGSRFVVTLLHALAAQADSLRDLGRPIELRLLDPNADRAGEMAHYARITAQECNLPLTAEVHTENDRAIDGSDWVIFSPNLRNRSYELFHHLTQGHPKVEHESGPWTAVDGAVVWPVFRQVAALVKQYCPHATLTDLVNPTDVLAPAASDLFGLQSHGMCVEVPNLRYFLSYYFSVPWQDIDLEFIGVNHHGWVTRCTIQGRDGVAMLRDAADDLAQRHDWQFGHAWFLKTVKRLGRMPTQNFHAWPTIAPDWEELAAERDAWYRRMLPGENDTRDVQERNLQHALRHGKMIEHFDSLKHTYGLPPYMFANVAPTFSALALGLMGGDGGAAEGPVSLQVRNGPSNPCLPPDVWAELPTIVRHGKLEPQTVTPPPPELFGITALVARQRRLIARWLATHDKSLLAEALYMMPESAHVDVLERICDTLPAEIDA
ncbi:MAG: hypothetical protein IT442_07010 [Phycisphaeraceae bacterium]|nr:hypothetical protein [Phycisphaeraceae bacterium]